MNIYKFSYTNGQNSSNELYYLGIEFNENLAVKEFYRSKEGYKLLYVETLDFSFLSKGEVYLFSSEWGK